LWAVLCFTCLSLNNVLLLFDFSLGASYDLSIWRAATNLTGILVFLGGLIWDTV
jgi:hypothetical protein